MATAAARTGSAATTGVSVGAATATLATRGRSIELPSTAESIPRR